MRAAGYRTRFVGWVRASAVLASAMVSFARPVPAQNTSSVTGVVTDDGGKPVPGALIVALDGARQLAARALLGRDGAFDLPLPTSRPLFIVSSVPTRISSEKARQKSVCGEPHDTASDVTNLWDEARKALVSTRLIFGRDELTAPLTRYDRKVSRDGKTVLSGTQRDANVSATRPYNNLTPDSIAQAGYLIEETNDIAYYAPDAELLLSTAFADSHCFGMLVPMSTPPTWIGLTFKPNDGDIGFTYLANGAWRLNRWGFACRWVRCSRASSCSTVRRAGKRMSPSNPCVPPAAW